jgi:hypothetical protein
MHFYNLALDTLPGTFSTVDCARYPKAVCFFAHRFWLRHADSEDRKYEAELYTLELFDRVTRLRSDCPFVAFGFGRLFEGSGDFATSERELNMIRVAARRGHLKAIDFLAERTRRRAALAKEVGFDEYMTECYRIEGEKADRHCDELLLNELAKSSNNSKKKKKNKKTKAKRNKGCKVNNHHDVCTTPVENVKDDDVNVDGEGCEMSNVRSLCFGRRSAMFRSRA